MSQYFLVQYTQQGNNELREAKRGEHIAFRKGLANALLLAGPLLSDAGDPEGSVVIIAAASRDEVEQIANADPFVIAGLLRIESIRRMRIAAMVPPPV